MKFPLLAKNELYLVTVTAVFLAFGIVSVLFRTPVDRSQMDFTVFFESDSRVFFFDGSKLPDDVGCELVVPVKDVPTDRRTVEAFSSAVKDRYVGNLEFYGNPEFIRQFYEVTQYSKIVKVHYVKSEELQRYNPDTLFKRLWRAVVERSVEVIILPDDELSRKAYEKLTAFFSVSKSIPKPAHVDFKNKFYGTLLGLYVTFHMPAAIFGFLFTRDYSIYVSLMSILGTIVLFFTSKNRFLTVTQFITLGILTNFALYSYPYVNDIYTYRGVKLSLVALPLTFAAFRIKELISLSEQRKELAKFMKLKLTILLLTGTAALVYAILRSGNYGFVLTFEEDFRLILENIFIVRPRTKELVFLPMLFFASTINDEFWSSFLTFFGTFGLVSIFNSFCHIKAPIFVTFYREIVTVLLASAIFVLLSILRSLILVWTRQK